MQKLTWERENLKEIIDMVDFANLLINVESQELVA